MIEIGYKLMAEEHGPPALARKHGAGRTGRVRLRRHFRPRRAKSRTAIAAGPWPEVRSCPNCPTPRASTPRAAASHKIDVAREVSLGPSPEPHLMAIRRYLDAGYDRLILTQIGPEQDAFFEFFERELRPALAS